MLDAGAAVAFPHTIDGAMRTDFAAWCFAMTAETVGEFGHSDSDFFDPSLVIWFQDTDLLLALQRAGRPPVHVPQARIRHGLSQTLATEDPQLSAWVREQIQADERCFRAKHAGLQLAPTTLTAAR
jgi:GT2 family glycosyltransferase